ncbi:MAG: HAD family hydrolase [candidate division Zixibacteria bacterium]|nr:HAD family hydrolase [candidate division Zixibacteria bacterium]
MSAGPDPSASAAFFDIDGTIVDATVVHYYAYFATYGHSKFRRLLWTVGFLPRVICFLVLDRISRSRFNRVFYRRYRGMDTARLRAQSRTHFEENLRPRLFPFVVERITEHRQRGERVVLITGSLDFIVEPLAEWLRADDLIAAHMTEENGRFTGELTGPPIGDEEKARLVRVYAAQRGIDLGRSHAYADSRSDMPMLETVGHAVVVNPGKKLKELAEKRGWERIVSRPSNT